MPAHEPLNEEQLGRLQAWLDEYGAEGVSLEWVDGLFCALICGPDLVMPREYLPLVFGDGVELGDGGEAADMFVLLMQHWNTIAGELLRTLSDEDHVYFPLLLTDADGVTRGNDWAEGFMRGVGMRPDGWRELLHSEEYGGALIPMVMLVNERDPDPDTRPPPIEGERRERVLVAMVAGLINAYRYFEPERAAPAFTPATPLRREGRKAGRNEPCPCGSGRKYKHCCAASGGVAKQ